MASPLPLMPPTLRQFGLLDFALGLSPEPDVSDERRAAEQQLAARVRARCFPPQMGRPVSRLHRPLLAEGSAVSSMLASPLWAGERMMLLLECQGDAELQGCWALAETGFVHRVLDAESLLCFAVREGGAAAVLEGSFVFNPKASDYVFVILDCLVLGGQPLMATHSFVERQRIVERFAASSNPPFSMIVNPVVPLASLPTLFAKVQWHPETSSRVYVVDELRLNVTGVRITPVDSMYSPGAVNERVLDWYYPRQVPLWLLARPLATEPPMLSFWLRDAAAGFIMLNPAHLTQLEAEECILQLLHDPAHGWCDVRGVYEAGSRALTSSAALLALSLHQQEQINKDELLSWVLPAPPAASMKQQQKQPQPQGHA